MSRGRGLKKNATKPVPLVRTNEAALSTTPPSSIPGGNGWKHVLKGNLEASILSLARRVARSYVGGQTIDDALCVSRRLASENLPNTLGYWNTGDSNARDVAETYFAAIEILSGARLDSYLSIKPPALCFDSTLALELAGAAVAHGIRLHCDSHGPEAADYSRCMVDTMLNGGIPAELMGTTLPGRWKRSIKDADWAIERGLKIRVVKGQWPDPKESARDPASGFLEVVDRVIGHVPCVAVATHDAQLALEAISRIRASGTPYELEVLLGSRNKFLLNWAKQHNVRARIYVPFGEGYVPNLIGLAKQNSGLAWMLPKKRV